MQKEVKFFFSLNDTSLLECSWKSFLSVSILPCSVFRLVLAVFEGGGITPSAECKRTCIFEDWFSGYCVLTQSDRVGPFWIREVFLKSFNLCRSRVKMIVRQKCRCYRKKLTVVCYLRYAGFDYSMVFSKGNL